MAAALLLGCPADVDKGDTDVAASDAADASPKRDAGASAREAAHDAALDRLLTVARPALDAGDPVAAFRLGRGPLVPPGASGPRRAELRSELSAAAREAKDLSVFALSPERGMLLRAVQAALARIDRCLGAKTAVRTDPSAYPHEARAFVEEVAGVLARRQADVDVPTALDALATELEAARGALGGASAASLPAGRDDARALAATLRRLPKIADGDAAITAAAERAATAADAMADHLDAVAGQIDAAKEAGWDGRLRPTNDPAAVRRLPAQWGAERLRVVLGDEELFEASPSDTLAALVVMAHRLAGMRPKVDAARDTPRPVDAARCEATRDAIVTWAQSQPPLAEASLDCEVFVRRMAGRDLDDADLDRAVTHLGVVEPTRWARRAQVEPALAMTPGRVVPFGQDLALQITVLTGAERTPALARAVDQAHAATCRAAAALVIHGELGGEQELASKLGADCDTQSAEAWAAQVRARPRAALDGLGLLALGSGPADGVAMHQFWWVPLGLVRPLARPPDPRALPPPPDTKVEPL